jgi:hypothetical protein
MMIIFSGTTMIIMQIGAGATGLHQEATETRIIKAVIELI